MGFVDLIKGMFSKEPEVVEEISLENIDKWFDEKYSSRRDFLKGQLDGIKAKAEEEIKSTRQSLENLRTAQLRNPNIPEKAKHFMEGNRNSYIKWTEQFIEKFKMPESAEEVTDFLSDFKKSLEEFSKLTLRPFKILSEFFEEEVSKVGSRIKRIDSLAGDVKEALKESKLRKMDELKNELTKVKSRISHKEFLNNEIKKTEARAEQQGKDKQRLEQDITGMENSTQYKDYNLLKHRLIQIKKESAEKESELAHMFSPLERPMKKYVRVIYNDKDLLEKYIESPVKALSQDFGFKIVLILANMKKAISDNSLELKDKQKEKAVEEIGNLDKDFLGKFISEYAQIRKKENELLKELKHFTIAGEIKEAKEKLIIASSMLEKAKSNLESFMSEISKVDIEGMKKELAEKIKSELNIQAVIS